MKAIKAKLDWALSVLCLGISRQRNEHQLQTYNVKFENRSAGNMSWGMQAGSTMATIRTIAILGGLHLQREEGEGGWMQFRPPCQGGPWPRAASNIFASSPPITTTVLQPVQKINIRQLPQRPTQRFWERQGQLVLTKVVLKRFEKILEGDTRSCQLTSACHTSLKPWSRECTRCTTDTPAHYTDLPVIATLPELVTHLASGSACMQVQQDNHVFIKCQACKA